MPSLWCLGCLGGCAGFSNTGSRSVEEVVRGGSCHGENILEKVCNRFIAFMSEGLNVGDNVR